MSEIYERNLELLCDRYPYFKALLAGTQLDQESPGFRVENNNGVLEFFDRSHLIERVEASFFEPAFQGKKEAINLVWLGFGLGGGLQMLLQNTKYENIFIIEPSLDRFLFALQQTDFSRILKDPSIEWLVGLEPEQIYAHSFEYFKEPERIQRMLSVEYYEHPDSQFDQLRYAKFKDEFQAGINQVWRSTGETHDALEGLKNVLNNITLIENTPGVAQLSDTFKGVDAVIVSAGPSLIKSLPLLKDYQNRVLIVAVDATAKVLLDHGIQPHFVTSIERTMASKPFFESLDAFSEELKSHLVCYPLLQPEVIEAYPGPAWVAYRNYPYFLYFEHLASRGILSSSTSVAHFALRLCKHLGVSRIALIGQDLAYDPETLQSHVDGVVYPEWNKAKTLEQLNKELQEKNQGQVLMVPGNKQQRVPTNALYFTMMKEFSWEAKQLQIPLYNCTHGGMRLESIEYLDFKEYLGEADLGEEDFFTWIDERRSEFEASTPISLVPVFESVSGYQQRLAQLVEQTSALNYQDSSIKIQAIPMLYNVIKTMSQEGFFRSFISEIALKEHVRFMNQFHEFSFASLDQTEQLQALKNWFQSMNDVAQKVMEVLRDHKNRPTASEKNDAV